MITIDSTPADNHESTLDTGTNDLGNDTRAHATLYSGQVEGACGLFGNSIDTGNIAANISGSNCDHIYSVGDELLSNCDHKSCVEDELPSNCDTKKSVEDETNSNCDTCLVEDESIRMGGENSIHLDVNSHDDACQPLGLEDEFCDIDAAQDSLLEDMVSCSLSNKPSECQIDLVNSVRQSKLCCGEHAHMHDLHSFTRGTTLKSGKQNKHCMMQQSVILPVRTMMISIMVYNMI